MVARNEFEIRHAPRRAGDPPSVVANSDQLVRLGWKPELNDLPMMIEHAYRWEQILAARPTPRRLCRQSDAEKATAAPVA
jgi:UDP-glucose 4-epimerase